MEFKKNIGSQQEVNEQVYIDWEKESKRTDRKHLRDLLQPNSSIDEVRKFTSEPFALDPDDVGTIYAIGHNHRLSQKGIKKGYRYDYSVESRIQLSFLTQKTKDIGINQKVRELFQKFIELDEKRNLSDDPTDWDVFDSQTQETFTESKDDLFKNLKEVAKRNKQLSKLIGICEWTYRYFVLINEIKFMEKSVKERWSDKTYCKDDPFLGRVPQYEGSMGSDSTGKLKEGYDRQDYHSYSTSLFIIASHLIPYLKEPRD